MDSPLDTTPSSRSLATKDKEKLKKKKSKKIPEKRKRREYQVYSTSTNVSSGSINISGQSNKEPTSFEENIDNNQLRKEKNSNTKRKQKQSKNNDYPNNFNSEWQQQVNEFNKTGRSTRMFKRIWILLATITAKKRNLIDDEEEEEEIVFVNSSIASTEHQSQPRLRPLEKISDHSNSTISLANINENALKSISSRDLVRSLRSAQSKRNISVCVDNDNEHNSQDFGKSKDMISVSKK